MRLKRQALRRRLRRQQRAKRIRSSSSIYVIVTIAVLAILHVILRPSSLKFGSLEMLNLKVGDELRVAMSEKEFHPDVCTKDQIELHKKLFYPFSPGATRDNTPLRAATSCPDDSSYINEYFGKMQSKTFLAVNVGCNKGLDAVAMTALLSQKRKFSVDTWKASLGNVYYPVCGMPQAQFFEDVPAREGRLFCIEPMPSTFGILQRSLDANIEYKESLVVTQAAISNTTGSILFPNKKAGTEDSGIGHCYEDPRPRGLSCTEVPLYTVDSYLKEQSVDLSSNGDMIDLMLIDSEGFDWEVIQGSEAAIKRARYVTFEVHIEGNWMQHSLVDTIERTFKDFNCYWVGKGKLWRMTNCMDDPQLRDMYEYKAWSNVGCVRRTEYALAERMESIFLRTLGLYNTTDVQPISSP